MMVLARNCEVCSSEALSPPRRRHCRFWWRTPGFGSHGGHSCLPLISSQKTGLQVLVGICSSLLNVGLNFAFVGPFGHVGLALASTASGFLTLAASFMLLRRDYRRHLNFRSLGASVARMVVAATVMAGAAIWLSEMTGLSAGTGDVLRDLLLLTAVSLVSAVLYFTLAAILGCDEGLRLTGWSGKRK